MNPARRTTQAATTALVLATAGALLSTAAPAASAATTCTSPVYKRQFFANTTFSGTPKKTDCDTAIAENWGARAPATGLPKDNFGVRWTVTRDFGSGGPFALSVAAQDGIRVYVDGAVKVNVWKNVTTTQKETVNLTVPKGKHTLRVDYAAWTGNANVNFAYTPRTSATVDKVRPLAPTGADINFLVQTADAVGIVSWAPNKELDLAGYRVYRRIAGSSNWTRAGTTTGLRFTTNQPSTGDDYYYEVRAYDKAGNESAGSTDQGPVPTDDRTPPTRPVLTAEGVEAANNLSWAASKGVKTYRVFRQADNENSFTKLTETTSTSYSDTSARYGDPYDYEVVAVDAAGNSAASNVVSSTRSIAPPSNIAVTTPSWGVVFTWTDPLGSKTADYSVYRSRTSPVVSDNNTRIDCTKSADGTDASGNTIHRCTDYDARRGVTYHYVMDRVNTAGRYSGDSSEITVTRPGDESPPPPVTGLTAEPLEYGVRLNWDASTATDLDRYWVYAGDPDGDHCGSNHNCEYIATVNADTTTYTDGPLPANGETKTYYVIAVDIYGNSLTYEDEDRAAWDSSVSQVTYTELDLTPTVVHEDTAEWYLSASANATTGSGVLSWSCVAYSTVTCDTSGFNVYRWDGSTGTYVRLTEVPLAATTKRYTDLTAPTGTTNHYVVSVVAADGTEAFTNVDYTVTLPSEA
ncbi:PA14 domain-containing protein [Streptomyces sp. SID12488]|uniref:PA14 domain-containing protein n=1 Tax=Streptomyces sp. SID12488 TaxID=2706040 RepID=UPI0013DD77A5|nr:PA14 domain-containing protein [Streptomyces sp. SID12488]NEA64480.1 hypothetical protein [Streptomyces sp. SID12488]